LADENGNKTIFTINRSGAATYEISQSSDLKKNSFKPATIYIEYDGLPETDTLELLLDYACDQKSSHGCHAIVLKYMKFNSMLLKNDTIRK